MPFRLRGRVESLLYAAALGAIAEIGDASQIMLFVLSFRFRNDTRAIVIGMVAAMIAVSLYLGVLRFWGSCSQADS